MIQLRERSHICDHMIQLRERSNIKIRVLTDVITWSILTFCTGSLPSPNSFTKKLFVKTAWQSRSVQDSRSISFISILDRTWLCQHVRQHKCSHHRDKHSPVGLDRKHTGQEIFPLPAFSLGLEGGVVVPSGARPLSKRRELESSRYSLKNRSFLHPHLLNMHSVRSISRRVTCERDSTIVFIWNSTWLMLSVHEEGSMLRRGASSFLAGSKERWTLLFLLDFEMAVLVNLRKNLYALREVSWIGVFCWNNISIINTCPQNWVSEPHTSDEWNENGDLRYNIMFFNSYQEPKG